jgi:hypothetical protein
MDGSMTDEVGDDDISVAREARAREARLRREITDQLLIDLCQADAAMRLDERAAVQFAVARIGMFVRGVAALDQGLGRFTDPVPDAALLRLGHALAGLNEGTVDPIVARAPEPSRRVVDAAEDKHQGIRLGPTANVELDHATAAAAVAILMLAGRARQAAAQEVVKALNDAPVLADIRGVPWRVVARWRDEIVKRAEKRASPAMVGQDVDYTTQAAGQFNSLVGIAECLKQDGAPPKILVKLAHDLLGRMRR